MSKPDLILARLLRLHPRLIDLSLGRMQRLLTALGEPQRHLPPVIHVAGTNGKGSTIAFLRAMLEASGRTVHTYTSPHLVHFNERIRLSGRAISDKALSTLLEECEEANRGEPITFFEITTAAAMLAFARTPADMLLLEVGLGGRLDATNVVERPALSVITPVSRDHMQYLGETLEEIAGEKAGILKKGVPAVVGPQAPEGAATIDSLARTRGAPLYRCGQEWQILPDAGGGFRYEGRDWRLDLPRPALLGRHQYFNAGAAIACLELLGDSTVSHDHLRSGLANAEWPGRLQRLRRGPLPALLPAGSELWLDGGHNAAAGEALAMVSDDWEGKPLHLVVGMLDTKDARSFFAPLATKVRSVRTVAIPGNAAAVPADRLAEDARSAGIAAHPETSVASAVAAILAGNPDPVRILICGSLYLAGTVLSAND